MGFAWFTIDSVLVAATALLLAASFRLRTLSAFLLAAYLLANAELVAVAEILSPFHAVTRTGYLGSGAPVALVAAGVWWARGRPRPPLGALRHIRELRSHPVLLILGVFVTLGLLYELVVGVTTPPNNWDSLWHHLVRVAAWRQYHAVEPIPNATAPLGINADPPDAEIEILFSVVLIGRDTLATMPQFLAECSLLVSVFGIARRIGFAMAPAAFAAFLTGTLSEIALQSMTTQNDLVVGALVAAGAFFVFGSSRIDIALAGLAVGLALGTKLTTVFVLPSLALLAFAVGGVRHTAKLAAWSAVALAAFGGFIYFRSSGDASTLAGTATTVSPGTTSLRAQPSLLGTASTTARVLYGFLDFSGFRPLFTSTTAMIVLLFSVPLAAIVVARRWTTSIALAAAVPLIGFLLSRVGHGLFALFHIPLNPPKATGDDTFTYRVQQYASENVSYFGPVGMLLLWPLSIWVLARWFLGEVDRRAAALASALPIVVVAFAATLKWDASAGRYFISAVALVMPLAAFLYGKPVFARALAIVGVASLVFVHAFDVAKPTGLAGTQPIWSMSRVDALTLERPGMKRILDRVAVRVPQDARVGLVLRPTDWSYPFYGPTLGRNVRFLEPGHLHRDAVADHLSWLIVHDPSWRWRIIKVARASRATQ